MFKPCTTTSLMIWAAPHSMFLIVSVATILPAQEPTQGSLEDNRHAEISTQHLSEELSEFFTPPNQWKNKLGTYESPLVNADSTLVTNATEWESRRMQLRSWWMSKLGTWPPLIKKQNLTISDSIDRENFTQHQVSFQWTRNEVTEGYLLVPKTKGKKPAVVTVFYEPETAIGLGKPNRDFALQLARRGFICLSIGTTHATKNKTYSLYHPTLENAEVQPLSMLAYAAANAWYVLSNHPQVDSKRIGIVGHSFGGKWAMFASCLFDHYACAAWSDPGIVFDEKRPSVNYWEPWYLGYHQPPWRKRGLITEDNPAYGLYPELRKENKDLHLLHALMAPRPFLVSGGSEDPPSRWEALNHTIQINDLLGFQNRVGMTNRPKHDPNEESNEVIYQFFQHFLQATHDKPSREQANTRR